MKICFGIGHPVNLTELLAAGKAKRGTTPAQTAARLRALFNWAHKRGYTGGGSYPVDYDGGQAIRAVGATWPSGRWRPRVTPATELDIRGLPLRDKATRDAQTERVIQVDQGYAGGKPVGTGRICGHNDRSAGY